MAKRSALASRLKSPNSRPGTATAHVPATVKRTGTHGASHPAPAPASTGGPHAAQIQSEAQLRFGPQADALGALLRQAIADRDQGIAVQKSTGTGLLALASRAQPAVAGIEAAGAARMQQPYQQVQANLAGLGPSADPIAAGVARDYALASANQVQDATAAAAELKQRQVDALSGRQAGIGAVQAQYATDKGKIADQASSLAGQQGAFTSSELARLLADDAKTRNQNRQNQLGRDLTRRGQDLSHQDRVAAAKARAKAKGPTLPGGAKLRSDSDHGKVADQIGQLTAEIKQHAADYGSDPKKARHALALDFSSGVPAQTLDDPQHPGQKLRDPGIPKAPSDLALSTALDLVYDGHISRRNLDRLHKRGFSINKLGLPTKAPGAPLPAGTGAAVVQATGRLYPGAAGR